MRELDVSSIAKLESARSLALSAADIASSELPSQLRPNAAPKQENVASGKQVQKTACAPSPLYGKYIEFAAEELYDPASLGDVQALKHKYDCQIHSPADAITYANEALAVTNDSYNRVMTPVESHSADEQMEGEVTGIGIETMRHGLDVDTKPSKPAPIDIVKVYADSPAANGGIKTGDQLISVNGKDITGDSLNDAITPVLGTLGTHVEVTIKRDNAPIDLDLVRQKVNYPVVQDLDLGNDIAYIALSDFDSVRGPDEMRKALKVHKKAQAYIIDMRDNGGGVIDNSIEIASMFIPSGKIVTISGRLPSSYVHPEYETDEYRLTKKSLVTTSLVGDHRIKNSSARARDLVGEKPVVILTNGNTDSAAEMFTAAVHDSGHAVTVGERTFGKGIGQTEMPVDGDTTEAITTIHYYTPQGLWPGDADKNRIGLKPDVEVANPKDAASMSSADKQLQTAIDLLKGKITSQ